MTMKQTGTLRYNFKFHMSFWFTNTTGLLIPPLLFLLFKNNCKWPIQSLQTTQRSSASPDGDECACRREVEQLTADMWLEQPGTEQAQNCGGDNQFQEEPTSTHPTMLVLDKHVMNSREFTKTCQHASWNSKKQQLTTQKMENKKQDSFSVQVTIKQLKISYNIK